MVSFVKRQVGFFAAQDTFTPEKSDSIYEIDKDEWPEAIFRFFMYYHLDSGKLRSIQEKGLEVPAKEKIKCIKDGLAWAKRVSKKKVPKVKRRMDMARKMGDNKRVQGKGLSAEAQNRTNI